MNRILIGAALLAASTLAQAACDHTLGMTVTYNGEPVAENQLTYHGFTPAQVAFVQQHGKAVLDVASKQQDKGGSYAAEFKEVVNCDGKVTDNPAVLIDGVTIQGMSKILRAAAKQEQALIKAGEDEAGKGKKRAWGKP
jgi:hypothetical protein